MVEEAKECPLCASRNISFSEREHALMCRDCGSVIAGTPIAIPVPKEEAIEIIHELPTKLKVAPKKLKVAKKVKVKKAKPKKAAKKAKKAVKKKVSKKPKKKSLVGRLLRRR